MMLQDFNSSSLVAGPAQDTGHWADHKSSNLMRSAAELHTGPGAERVSAMAAAAMTCCMLQNMLPVYCDHFSAFL